MAHYSTKKYTYPHQLAILLLLLGAGLIVGGIISILPLLTKINFNDVLTGKSEAIVDNLLTVENANLIRLMQFISTLFLFFIPAYLYAKICHHKPLTHLGLTTGPKARTLLLVGVIMIVALPAVNYLQQLTEMLPWSKELMKRFKDAEKQFNDQIEVIGRMNNFGDFLMSVFFIAFLPALFEEVFFRGGIQNLLTRWFKRPMLALIVTSILFSAIHFSALGFLSRALLGFILGWFYYKTNNLYLNVFGHFVNNALGVLVIYLSQVPGKKQDLSAIDDQFPLVAVLLSVLLLIYLFRLFEKVAAPEIFEPGKELDMPGYEAPNPFINH